MVGGVKYHYFLESSWYQYVGSCAAGLDQLESSFSISSPYFYLHEMDELDPAMVKMKVESRLESRIGYLESLSSETKFIVLYCFPGVC